jgi:hypothetical protein
VAAFLGEVRGRGHQLAKFLRVADYQSHRWFVSRKVDPPAWAVFEVITWFETARRGGIIVTL